MCNRTTPAARFAIENTRLKVEAAIEALGYHPHIGARALASNRSNVLALMAPMRGDMYAPLLSLLRLSKRVVPDDSGVVARCALVGRA